jgi:hypothetical protein
MSDAKLRPRTLISAGPTNATVQTDHGNKHATCYQQWPSLRTDDPVPKVDPTASRWSQNPPAPYSSYVATGQSLRSNQVVLAIFQPAAV